MSIEQAIASNAGLKFAAGGLAGALALGGGAAATGNLSCETVAPEAIGSLLVETGLEGRAEAQVETQRIEVEGLGFVDVAHSDADVEVVDLRASEGASAELRSQSRSSAEIDFILDGVTRTLLVSVVDGELLASLAPALPVEGSALADGAIEAESDVSSHGALSIEGGASAAGGEAEVGLLGSLGINIGLDG